ncbi:single-stranded DNA-binding protein [Mammaliicoccus sciuri]|uniref:single-stranded DNA-binding protein n=1 Tax=Mammaliicoccus sciuri TaxID=1296 RepID=UPI001F1E408E|nr:single-stranded DNA-binding protein [Mammaliicoccus sciuri]MCE5086336.1 single-stranded DNA-binding protein [Mammaliicoccus sciuri]
MNTVNLVGNVASDYYINEYQDKKGNKQYVINGTIAINEPQGNGKEPIVTFIDFTAFSGLAKILKDLTVKGSQLAITGKWRKDHYESNGQKRSKDYVLVQSLDLLDTKEQTEQKRAKSLQGLAKQQTDSNYNDSDIPPANAEDDDLPF